MLLFDWLMRGPDSYWKKQFNAERIRRQRAEADAKCYKDEADYNHESLSILTDRDLKQSRAIETYNKEIASLKAGTEKLRETIAGKDREISMLQEALRSERDLNAALRTNSKLWENIKQNVKEAN